MNKDIQQVTMGLDPNDRINAEVLRVILELKNKATATSYALALARMVAEQLRLPDGSRLAMLRPNGKVDLLNMEGFTDAFLTSAT